MAIRYPGKGGGFVSTDQDLLASITGGWHAQVMDHGQGSNTFLISTSFQAFQPSRLTRPGNLGTAYIGVWTGNISQE